MEQLRLIGSLSSIDVKKFDGNDFKLWFEEVKLWVDSLGLSELLDITPEQNVNPETTKKLKMLRARILCLIREDIRSALLECDLPSQIIDQLKNRFDKQNQFHKANLTDKLINLKMKPDDDLFNCLFMSF